MPRLLEGKRIVIDPGHGGKDPGGTSPDGHKEADFVIRVAEAVVTYFKDRLSLHTYSTRTRGMSNVPDVNRRVELVNKNFNADVVLSLHMNTSPSPSSRGWWLIHDDAQSPHMLESVKLAHHIQNVVTGYTGKNSVGDQPKVTVITPDDTPYVSGRDLAIVSDTNCPAVLVELGFITNSFDRIYAWNHPDEIAEILASSLIKYYRASTPAPRTLEERVAALEERMDNFLGQVSNH